MSSKKPLTKAQKLQYDKKYSEKKSLYIPKKYFVIAIIILLAASYKLYFFKSEDVTPKVDLEQWWGSYPMSEIDTSIRPFTIEFSDIKVNDLKERLLHRAPFAPPLDSAGFSYGFNSLFLPKVLDFWQKEYNFEERERFLNKYNHFITGIQGLDVHYMHVKPDLGDGGDITVIPILLIHGWPGSIREFYELIPKLVTPRPNHKFVFEVIAPSIPGFGYSQAPTQQGMGPQEVAVVFYNLMKRIGYSKYYVQGGNYGAKIGSAMATLFPDAVLGFHTNTPSVMWSPMAVFYTLIGTIWPSFIVEPSIADRMYPLSQYLTTIIQETGHFHIQATKPDTVGIALSDSPAGLAAYILEKFSAWTDKENKQAIDGALLQKFSLTHLLDNVMIYWTTNSITSSMRHYTEYKQLLDLDRIPTDVPTWGIKFKHNLFFQPDSILRLKYRNYLHSSIVEDGGHFAAMELPDVLADDIFDAVDTFIKFHEEKKKNEPKSEPTQSNAQQTESAKKPTESAKKPTESAKGQTESAKKQTDSAKKPTESAKEPKESAKEPTESAKQPTQVDYMKAKSVHEFTVKDIHGNEVKLDRYKGQVLIIVNVASQCGYTDGHYKQLNELYEKYSTKGLRILAFPCNQFGYQEPGTPQEILQFTKAKQVKFDLFEKVAVNGADAHPLWNFLKRMQGGTLGDFVKWNFSKFIVDKNGVPVERFGPNTDPLELVPYLEKLFDQ
ncbi:juvenile hormone epoxide hydrolase-like [Spodoptera frugiperda]|uniref:Glutathione peroxidase n=1 Tax=Spodoptera frugiperda TaxID=7108 RepID=A0A9R0F026_SPOFR|nr:juvenile hormone epoxide hydrolase-like [Spodoptera frugiperda]